MRSAAPRRRSSRRHEVREARCRFHLERRARAAVGRTDRKQVHADCRRRHDDRAESQREQKEAEPEHEREHERQPEVDGVVVVELLGGVAADVHLGVDLRERTRQPAAQLADGRDRALAVWIRRDRNRDAGDRAGLVRLDGRLAEDRAAGELLLELGQSAFTAGSRTSPATAISTGSVDCSGTLLSGGGSPASTRSGRAAWQPPRCPCRVRARVRRARAAGRRRARG